MRVDYTTFPASPEYLAFDGKTMWLIDESRGVERLDSAGNVVQTIPTAGTPGRPAFDGANLWVPLSNPGAGFSAIVVIRVSDGTALTTIMGNGLNAPSSAAFDGERILVTNPNTGVSIFQAASLAPSETSRREPRTSIPAATA